MKQSRFHRPIESFGFKRDLLLQAASDRVRQVLMLNSDGSPNPLEEYFLANKGRLIWKWMHYFEIYHRHFAPYRDKPVTIVEFGVLHGGSLQMWKHYFGRSARIVGVDINPLCQDLEEDQIEIVIGDQDDRNFLRALKEKTGPVDVLIEDGGHQMTQQIATFKEMFPALKSGGIYLVEDLHTSYWEEFGGSYRRPGTSSSLPNNLWTSCTVGIRATPKI